MESLRVDICYRPLRIAWAIRAGDVNAFRSAARFSFALWGGRFNPIVVVDQEELAQNLVDLFRPDMIIPVGDSEIVKSFPKRFKYLPNPYFHEGVFIGESAEGRSQVLDIHNALVYLQGKPEWQAIKKAGVRLYTWAPDDFLADVLMCSSIRASHSCLATVLSAITAYAQAGILQGSTPATPWWHNIKRF